MAVEAHLKAGRSVCVDLAHFPTVAAAMRARTGEGGKRCVHLRPPRPGGLGQITTRSRDILLAAIGLSVCAPIIGSAALLVRLSERGGALPIFFRATVVGQHGRRFIWHKIRTMRPGQPDADSRRAQQFAAFVSGARPPGAGSKILDESRTTGVSRFLRRHSIDELPQLWNVLAGKMSLVGPRPLLEYEWELQEPWHTLRFSVPPGLTGVWQVYGRSRVTFQEMAIMDYCYARSRSFVMDIRLLVATAYVVVAGRGGR